MQNKDYFNQNGYVIIKSALQKDLVDFFTQYALFDEMQDYNEGDWIKGAHTKYADPAMETILLKLHSVMEENTGLQLFPTYSFYRVYRHGNELPKHKDRESCEISATMCFNHSYDRSQYKWPIYVDGKEIDLEPTDMVIYKGIDLLHWREPFLNDVDDWHVQGFFHYVDQNGPYRDFKFDGRDSIGSPKMHTTHKNYITYTR